MRHKTHRDAIKAFSDAGFDVTLKRGRKHTLVCLNGEVVHMLSHGPKQDPRNYADLRRKIRRLEEARDASGGLKLTRR